MLAALPIPSTGVEVELYLDRVEAVVEADDPEVAIADVLAMDVAGSGIVVQGRGEHSATLQAMCGSWALVRGRISLVLGFPRLLCQGVSPAANPPQRPPPTMTTNLSDREYEPSPSHTAGGPRYCHHGGG
eukprot:EG_transcript_41229